MAEEFKPTESQDETQIFRMPSADATVPDLMGKQASPTPTLTIVKGPQTGVTFTLDTPVITLGRDPSNSIFLNDMTVSRHHARMELADIGQGVVTVEDLRSLNGTWVDGAIVNKAILHEGSTLQIGTFRMIFHSQRPKSRIEVGV